jgi:hypothetical protein
VGTHEGEAPMSVDKTDLCKEIIRAARLLRDRGEQIDALEDALVSAFDHMTTGMAELVHQERMKELHR